MSIDVKRAHHLALAGLAQSTGDALQLTAVESLPAPAYGFDPNGWCLFLVSRQPALWVGGDEYVAVHSQTGEFRRLGTIGD